MIRARSCWCSGVRDWMDGTVDVQTLRKGRKETGQFERESSAGLSCDLERRGRGTEGGLVVERRAAK